MAVEPHSHCWLCGRLSDSRDGEEWAKELRHLPGLEYLVRDGARGLANGLARVNRERRQAGRPRTGDQLDHFHTLREGCRALRQTQAQAERAWAAAEEADRKVAQKGRRGQARAGYATVAVLKWQKAEEAFRRWESAERAFERIRQAPRPFTASGELNTRGTSRSSPFTLSHLRTRARMSVAGRILVAVLWRPELVAGQSRANGAA
jgi:hypothetical protein